MLLTGNLRSFLSGHTTCYKSFHEKFACPHPEHNLPVANQKSVQASSSPEACPTTSALSALFDARIHSFGLSASRLARLSALSALYQRRPRFRFTSRDIVEGDLFSRLAIERMLFLADRPPLISSRSSSVRCRGGRFLSVGLIPVNGQ